MLSITVLLENESISPDLACEHGLSLLLACDGKTFLLDAGEGDAALRNARTMNADLGAVDAVILSHGHFDHTGGLGHMLGHFAEQACRAGECSRPPLPGVILHPDALSSRRKMATEANPGKDIGMPEQSLAALCDWPKRLVREPLRLTERLIYLGEIPRKYPETQALLGEIRRNGGYEPDPILDDSALVYISGTGKDASLAVIAGCAHSGIINTVEHAKAVAGINSVSAVIGGMHMKDASPALKERTLRYFDEQKIGRLHGCHCTGSALDGVARQRPLHAGDRLEIA